MQTQNLQVCKLLLDEIVSQAIINLQPLSRIKLLRLKSRFLQLSKDGSKLFQNHLMFSYSRYSGKQINAITMLFGAMALHILNHFTKTFNSSFCIALLILGGGLGGYIIGRNGNHFFHSGYYHHLKYVNSIFLKIDKTLDQQSAFLKYAYMETDGIETSILARALK